MSATPSTRLDAASLIALAGEADQAQACAVCAPLRRPGWESMPASFDRQALAPVGTLRDVDDEDPTVVEHHPAGTHQWSPDAPIALRYFPYNRCDVWQCQHCRRAFLRYTEYGGYYHDERVRPVDAALVTP